jgi:hypothetical protein
MSELLARGGSLRAAFFFAVFLRALPRPDEARLVDRVGRRFLATTHSSQWMTEV